MSAKVKRSEASWVEGDKVTFTTTFLEEDDGDAITVTGGTVNFIYWFDSKKATKASGSVSGTTGGTYALTIPDHGILNWEWRVTLSAVPYHSTEVFSKRVRKKTVV